MCSNIKYRGGDYIADINIYENGWNSINTYIFGLIMSDGCLCLQGRNKNRLIINITLNDEEMITWIHDYMCVGNKVYHYKKSHSLVYRNQDAISFLMDNGLTERKSTTLQFPKNIPDEYLKDFIRGYFDGDGSISFQNAEWNTYGHVQFTCGSIDFLNYLQNILENKFNIKSGIYFGGHPNISSYTLMVTRRREVDKFFISIYDNAQIYLKRKYDRFIKLQNIPLKYKVK